MPIFPEIRQPSGLIDPQRAMQILNLRRENNFYEVGV